VDAWLREDINFAVEQLLEILSEANEIEERSPGLHVDQKVHVARGTRFIPGNRPEPTDVARAVLGGDPEDFVPSAVHIHWPLHSAAEAPIRQRRSNPNPGLY